MEWNIVNISFKNIAIFAKIEKETEIYTHYVLDEVRDRYDSNFIQFKKIPSLRDLTSIESYLKKYHQSHGRKHLKFVFPQDKEVPMTIRHYLKNESYEIGILEMYAIKPRVFLSIALNNETTIEYVTNKTLSRYLTLHYEDALQWGPSYALGKGKMQERDFHEKRKVQIIARIGDEVVGSTDLIVCKRTAEIDNLYVLPKYQRQGIGTKIQQFVMDNYTNKTIILVADGEDTPREMYTKQGYIYLGKQYNALKMDMSK